MTATTVQLAEATTRLSDEIARGANCSVIGLVETVLAVAFLRGASDIHIDPSLSGLRVRLRIDGVLHEECVIAREVQNEVISRIKVLAGLRTDEHQAAQDGRIRHTIGEGEVLDIRVAICPTYHGENCVMRLLTASKETLTLQSLGFSKSDQKKINNALLKPSGMILATGPTGSGKTTTLYTLLDKVRTPEISIITIEDPIEYAVDGIEQIQVNARSGLTFANGLRSILRQDPNVIMVGEIRDAETAGIAVNTALTGHLLLSTLHTNDAATTLPRLLDMKIEAFLVATTVSVAIAQRLVRTICPECKTEGVLSDAARERLEVIGKGEKVRTVMRGAGCDACAHTGYKGRVCICEVLEADDDVRDAIIRRASSSEIKAIAVRNGMTTMLEDGLDKVARGVTTVEEVLRVIQD